MIYKRKAYVIALKERQGKNLPGLSALSRIIHYHFTGLRKACPVLILCRAFSPFDFLLVDNFNANWEIKNARLLRAFFIPVRFTL